MREKLEVTMRVDTDRAFEAVKRATGSFYDEHPDKEIMHIEVDHSHKCWGVRIEAYSDGKP